MDIIHAWLFVYLFVLDSFSSAELYRHLDELPAKYIKNGHFRVLKQHPALKKCAIAIAKEKWYFENPNNDGIFICSTQYRNNYLDSTGSEDSHMLCGGMYFQVKYAALRVNEQTGECQGLPSQWLDNQRIERGYAYAKRMNLEEDFEPPVQVAVKTRLTWLLHGMFKEGSKLDMFISIVKPHDPLTIGIYLNTPFDDWASGGDMYEYEILIKSEEIGNTVEFIESKNARPLEEIYKNFVNSWPAAFSSGKVFKISVLANAGAITVLVDDEEFCTFKTITNFPMYKLALQTHENPVVLYGIQITVE